MDEELERLAFVLFDKGLILLNGPFPFKLHEEHPDAPVSPVRLNLRLPPRGVLTSETIEQIANALYVLCCQSQIQYDCVVGVPRTGNSLAMALSKLTSVSFLSLEKEETRGRRRVLSTLHGSYQSGQRALILDDVVTSAASTFETISALEANGLLIAGIETVADWEHGGMDDLVTAGFLARSLFTMRELFRLYLEEGRVTQEKYQEVIAYLKAIRRYLGRV